MEEYNLSRVVPILVDFIDNLTNWYIRRSRRRFWKSENDSDKAMAYATLYYVLVQFSRVMAPYLPFLTEAIWRNLAASQHASAPESVHLTNFPQPDESAIAPDLESRMSLVRAVVGLGRLLRSRHVIKNRQPLADITVIIRSDRERDLVKDMGTLLPKSLMLKR
jgi:isoleucyl-tRNA synthetase